MSTCWEAATDDNFTQGVMADKLAEARDKLMHAMVLQVICCLEETTFSTMDLSLSRGASPVKSPLFLHSVTRLDNK